MANVDGRVDVGDKKTVEISTTDANGDPLTVTGAEVTMTSPSGQIDTYDKTDMREQGNALFLEVLFDEPGFWFAEIQVTNAGGQETDRRVYRAITREPADLSLMTRDVWHEHLAEDVMAEGPDVLQRLIDRAERKVVDRYRRENALHDDELVLEPPFFDGRVQLDGWEADDNGDPDLGRMDDDLLAALRESISRVVEHWIRQPDDADYISSMSQGDRSVDFRERQLEVPRSAYAPLRRFDHRDPWY